VQLTRRCQGDAGFTLIELLLVVVILGLITVPLGNAVLGIIENTDATSQRLALSHDAQISTAYFAEDVAGMGTHDYSSSAAPLKASVQLGAAYNAGPTCGAAGTPNAVVRFLYDDYDLSSPPVLRVDVVAYVVEPVSGSTELHRIRCLGSPSPVSDTVVAHNVNPTIVPTVTCLQPTVCTGASVPKTVTLSFTVSSPAGGSYPIVLAGQRRQS
jgi:prepilin-type N-terminal cleavage/methylation domain-containing protein